MDRRHPSARWCMPGIVLSGMVSLSIAATAVAAPRAAPTRLVQHFQTLEQALMDAVAVGDRAVWARAMDPSCIVTSEEGQVQTRDQFLNDLRPLPPGLTGGITVRELAVQAYSTFVVVRYLADEWESVFGQRLTTKYRMTDTFRRVGSAWRMVASHTAVVTLDPPAQPVAQENWRALVGTYRLLPGGWTFHVDLRDGVLCGGRDPAKLRRLIPLTPDAFVLEGSLGEWLFVVNPDDRADRIVNLRKFEPLIWTRVDR